MDYDTNRFRTLLHVHDKYVYIENLRLLQIYKIITYFTPIDETHVRAVGSFHNLYLRLHETTPIAKKDETGVRILVHERREFPVVTARTNSMSAELGWSREVKIELRKVSKIINYMYCV